MTAEVRYRFGFSENRVFFRGFHLEILVHAQIPIKLTQTHLAESSIPPKFSVAAGEFTCVRRASNLTDNTQYPCSNHQ